MSDKLHWNEIREKYPEEWVLLEDSFVEENEKVGGVVVAHGKERKPLSSLCRSARSPVALVWTGPITKGFFGVYDKVETRR